MQSNTRPLSYRSAQEILINDFYDRNRFYLIKIREDGRWIWKDVVNANHAEVRGFGILVTYEGQVELAAYYSNSRSGAEHAPDYKDDLWFFFGSEIFDLQSATVVVEFGAGIFSRTFFIANSGDQESVRQRRYSYQWPFYRQLAARLIGDPFNFVSQDFFWEFRRLLKVYRPERLRG